MRDLQFALSAFDFLLEVDESGEYSKVELRRFRCFLDAGIIAYGRPFTQTKGVPLLSFKQIGIRPTQSELALHEALLEYRHKVVAHSDADRMRIAVSSFAPFDDRPEIRMPIMHTDEGLAFLDRRDEVVAWLRILRSALGAKTFALVQTTDGLEFTMDYLARSTEN